MSTKQDLLDNVNAIVDEIKGTDNISAWLDEQLSIECIMRNTSGDYMGAEILCCCGGPDVRVDTRWGTVEGQWGQDHFSRPVDCEELNNLIEELF